MPTLIKWLSSLCLMLACVDAAAQLQVWGDYPPTELRPESTRYAGIQVGDPYAWLDRADDPNSKRWLRKQRELSQSVLAHIGGSAALAQRLQALAPALLGGEGEVAGLQATPDKLFFMRRELSRNSAALYMRNLLTGGERLLLAPQGDETIAYFSASPDGEYLAVATTQRDTAGAQLRLLHVRDGTWLSRAPGRVSARLDDLAWMPDSSGVFYRRAPEQGGAAVYLHRIGAAELADQAVSGARNAPAGVGKGKGEMARLITQIDSPFALLEICTVPETACRYHYAKISEIKGAATRWRVLAPASQGLYAGRLAGERALFLSMLRAPHGRLFEFKLSADKPAARLLYAADAGLLQEFAPAQDAIYLHMRDGASKLFKLSGGVASELALPLAGSIGQLRARADLDGVALTIGGWAGPPQTYQVRADGTFIALLPAPASAPTSIESKTLQYPGADGKKLALTWLGPAGARPDATRALLLLPYRARPGGLAPYPDARRLAWFEQGGAIALVELRTAEPVLAQADLCAAAAYLQKEGYAAPGKLALSADADLAGAAAACMLTRPELFAAAYLYGGVMDRLPVAPRAQSAPRSAAQVKAAVLASPYRQISDGRKYPAALIGADTDAGQRRMVARLQAASANAGKPVLLLTAEPGLAQAWAFLLWQMGDKNFAFAPAETGETAAPRPSR